MGTEKPLDGDILPPKVNGLGLGVGPSEDGDRAVLDAGFDGASEVWAVDRDAGVFLWCGLEWIGLDWIDVVLASFKVA